MKQKNQIWDCVLILLFSIGFCMLIWKVGFDILVAELNKEIQNENINNETVLEAMMCDIGEDELEPVFELSDEDRWYIECIVAGEAKGEPTLGKMAVAQCIRNAMLKDEIGPQEVKSKYGYCGWDENLKSVNEEAYNDVADAVWRVFDNGESVSSNPILFFYAYKTTTSRWHEAQEFDQDICCHRFFYLEEDVNADWFKNIDFNT